VLRLPSTLVGSPEHGCRPTQAPCRRSSQCPSRRMPTLLSVLPSGLVSPPSISCRPTQVPRSLSREVHRLSRALLYAVRATDVSAPSHFIPGPSQVRGAAQRSCVATQSPRSRSLVVSWRSKAAPSQLSPLSRTLSAFAMPLLTAAQSMKTGSRSASLLAGTSRSSL